MAFGRFAQRLPVYLLLMAVFVAACGQATTKEPSAAALMPNLPGYQTADTLDIQDTITKIAGATSLGAGHPELTGLIAGINNLVACYQKAGAVQGRTYVNSADPTRAGIVVIVNRNAVTDPNTFIGCVLPQGPSLRAAQLQPCAKAYTLNRDTNQFYIGYAATDPQVCQAFCSTLQGCTS